MNIWWLMIVYSEENTHKDISNIELKMSTEINNQQPYTWMTRLVDSGCSTDITKSQTMVKDLSVIIGNLMNGKNPIIDHLFHQYKIYLLSY